ncbi:nitrate- and nitrite sensing domain-containing protein [Kitasatospora sp. NBC_00240]|uniref:nitrate- and nitrite sensing domain-containing protein n=1 Tax=Kitasatospora sp. NBC_00240 TaxID=2903567 RepID=UPI00225B549D|nr:nitrate- and nitrite sensing domain-containing protein [Kitasatospora sp. NBC_00240]MCX5209868.1 nitrate- and nitrite sensing domain-containing protein [Kitasatospora sp. NBC_00240]
MVPGLALAALWAVTSGQTIFDFQRQAGQGLLAQKAGQPSNIVYYNLQEERRLSAEALVDPGASTEALRRQRQLTDEAVRTFQALSEDVAADAPAEVRTAVFQARQAMTQLPAQRAMIDRGSADQQAVFSYYTDLISVDLSLFTALSHVDNGEMTYISRALVDAFWAKEMLAREDAVLARGWQSGKLSTADLQLVQQSIGNQSFLITTKITPYLPAAEAPAWQTLTNSAAWQAKAAVEQALMRPAATEAGGGVKLPPLQDQWRQAVDQVNPQLVKLMETRTAGVVEVGKSTTIALLVKVALTSLVGLLAVVAVIITTWRLTRSLRRRILELQGQAQELERTLPEVVERLGRGEQVDVEAESRAVGDQGEATASDELGQLGHALNLARTSALETAVRQADQYRGFERLLQRIARRTQLLIGLQLKKLDELERRHEDPEVLEGLFDLDHLTARLRRYEENLVILAGGQPQRRWRKPVPLLDVLRSAQGEVQDYRRIMLDVEGSPWLSERAVGPVAHVLAELMENAATFSRPPTPVEVRAAVVGRGLAIEIEDRGLGMDPEQFAAANELMSRPPRMDVLAKADDIRLGFYVVARLAANSGLRVEFRPSAFGGTRVVVLVPAELVSDGNPEHENAVPVEPIPLPARNRGRALAGVPAALPEPMATVLSLPELPEADHREPGFAEPTYAEAEFAEAQYSGAGRPRRSRPAAGFGTDGFPAPGFGTDAPAADGFAGDRFAADGFGTDGPMTPRLPVPGFPADGFPTGGYTPDRFPGEADPAPAFGYPEHDGPAAGYADDRHRGATHPYTEHAPTGHDRPAARPSWASPPDAYGHGGQSGEALTADEKPLPRRVRQAHLAAELRLPPPGQGLPAQAPPPAEDVFRSPAPRRSGAAIGAFQRQSRAARGQGEDTGTQQHPAVPAPSPSPWDGPRTDPNTPRTEDRT